jgi:phosphate-selective porin OprO/OprP
MQWTFFWLPRLFIAVLLALGLGVVCVGQVEAQPSQDSRLEAKVLELEKRIRELEAGKSVGEKPKDAKPLLPADFHGEIPHPVSSGPPVVAETAEQAAVPMQKSFGFDPAFNDFKDGFILKSVDNVHQLRVTGQIQADYRTYPMRGDGTDPDGFLLRRARFGIEATLFDHYEFRFLPDWGNGKQVIQDGYMNIHYWDELQFQVGKFKEPVSYEQLILDRFVPTMERSLIDQVVPARDEGLMIHGQKLLGNHFDYAFGIFNGTINGDGDTNKLRDFAGGIAWRPLNNARFPEIFQGLQIGISGTIGKEQEPMNPNTLRTPANIPWLTFAATVRADGVRSRWTPEVSYFYQSFGFAAQYLRMDQEMRSGIVTTVKGVTTLDPVVNIPFEGYYFLATYLLTGEQRTTYSDAVSPLRPFDPLHPFRAPGAWELVTRMSHLQVGDQIFLPGNLRLANPATNASSATELTLGFNWYFNSSVRMQFNWEHAWFNRPLTLGTNAFFPQTNAAMVRFQIIF